MICDLFDFLSELLAWAVAIALSIITFAIIALAIVAEIKGEGDSPRIDAAYWAERGYDTTGCGAGYWEEGKP